MTKYGSTSVTLVGHSLGKKIVAFVPPLDLTPFHIDRSDPLTARLCLSPVAPPEEHDLQDRRIRSTPCKPFPELYHTDASSHIH